MAIASTGEETSIVAEETLHDFGNISAASIYRHSFYLRNDGDQQGVVTSHVSSCGCTVVNLKSKTILPSGRLEIPVELRGAGQTGPFEGKVFLQVDKLQKPIELKVKANFSTLKSDLETFPKKIVFYAAVPERLDSELLIVKRKDDSPLGRVAITTDNPTLEVIDVQSMRSNDGIEYAVARIRAVKGTPGASFSAQVSAQGEKGQEDRVTCPVEGSFVGINQLYPNDFLLNLIGRENVHQPLEVSNALGKPITITAVKPEPADLPGNITFTRVHDARWEVRYEVKAADVPKDTMEGQVSIEFGDKSMSPLVVPVFIMK